jgi:hypothetical protein
METGIELIAKERQEQISKHGFTIDFDKRENYCEQLSEAACKLLPPGLGHDDEIPRRPDGWNKKLWIKMCEKTYNERLIIAGALIAAEIDRLQQIEFTSKNDDIEEMQDFYDPSKDMTDFEMPFPINKEDKK